MNDQSMKGLKDRSYLSGGNAYMEAMYEMYLEEASAVPADWRQYFDTLNQDGGPVDVAHSEIRTAFKARTRHVRPASGGSSVDDFYRRRGHMYANTNPLPSDRASVPVEESSLKSTYCGSIGFEVQHISNEEEVAWLQAEIESGYPKVKLSGDERIALLNKLIQANGLESYLGTRYVAQKRFSLEGGDALIPMIDRLVHQAGASGHRECVIGMAHRGRLNVMLNIMGMPSGELFNEFEGKKDYGMTSGDVKYHLGLSSDVQTAGGPLHLSLMFNPSHLEIVSPVAMGSVRARQGRYEEEGASKDQAIPILIHGDAAFAGQGVVMESLAMSQTAAYGIGGAIHIIVNNQVGFTTSKPQDARSSRYASDPAKMIDAPVFHVNGDDPEAVLFVAQLAFDYRQRFHKDVVIDLVCYRRHGHNEADEPAATQPLMYQFIKKHPTPYQLYAKQLIAQGVISQSEVDGMVNAYIATLDAGLSTIDTLDPSQSIAKQSDWTPYLDGRWTHATKTGVPLKTLKALGQKLVTLPEGFKPQRQVAMMLSHRAEMYAGKRPLDWGAAETLAYATLLDEGSAIRMTGQDCQRGTFAHRHAVLHDQVNDQECTPLRSCGESFEVHNSLLSEEAVLGFEYGYSKSSPETLVIWEAQFGDFANTAQSVIDQFISAGWQKWKQLSGLVMLLPHGYEGMGPEHSSARLERYLQLCAQENIQVCVPSTPAQCFHMLRRQLKRPFRKPLIVMTPKSMLRHKLAVSDLSLLAKGQFELVLPEADLKPKTVKRVVICSGKVYYDLLEARTEAGRDDVAIVRLEQLYPFPEEALRAELARFKGCEQVVWCQEEPRNQGAWYVLFERLQGCLAKGLRLEYAGREASSSPAVGYAKLHHAQQAQLVKDALG